MSAHEETIYSAGSLAGLTPTTRAKPSPVNANENTATYRIAFWGQCQRGANRDDVLAAFAQRFKIANKRQLEQLFSGKVITLKKGLDENQANKYMNAILEVGALCRKESEFRDYFSETETKTRNSVTFLDDDFDPSALSLTPKDEFSPTN